MKKSISGSPEDTPVRALVIDDRKVNRDLLRQMLREVGCHVKTAACSEDAQELLAKYSPKVVFIDARLPGMDSAAAVELLRDRCRNRPQAGVLLGRRLRTRMATLPRRGLRRFPAQAAQL
ncbi:MAG: response regulator [Chthoniobacter sp.]